MTDESHWLSKRDGDCIALYRGGKKANERCQSTARFYNLFCERHWTSYSRDPHWPFANEFEPYRYQISDWLRANSDQQGATPKQSTESDPPPAEPEAQKEQPRVPNDQPKDPSPGLLSWLLDAKVIATVLIALAAFVSEFFFLLPFDIDYTFFIGTVEAIPLFIRNLAFILIFCIIGFVGICASIISVQIVFSMSLAIFKTIQLESLRFLLRSILRILITQSSMTYVKLSSKTISRSEILKKEEKVSRIKASISTISESIFEEWRIFCKNVVGLLNEILTNGKRRLYFQIFDSFPPNFITKRPIVKASLVLVVLIVPWGIRYMDGATMATCVRSLIGPRALLADRACPKDGSEDWLVYAGINLADFDIEINRTEDIDGEDILSEKLQAKIDYLVDGIVTTWSVKLEAYEHGQSSSNELQTVDEEIQSETKDKLKKTSRQYLVRLIEESEVTGFWNTYRPFYRKVYGRLREFENPLVHNYPIVTITFKDSPTVYRTDAVTSGLQTLCLPEFNEDHDGLGSRVDYQNHSASETKNLQKRSGTAKVSFPTRELTLKDLADSILLEDACQLVDGNVSARMLYLGEAGAWTLLYSLGPDGAPIFFKTEDIASISYKPVTIQSPSNQDKSLDGITVNVGTPDLGPDSLDATLNARLDAKLELDPNLTTWLAKTTKIIQDIQSALVRVETRLKLWPEVFEVESCSLEDSNESVGSQLCAIKTSIEESNDELERLRQDLLERLEIMAPAIELPFRSLESELERINDNLTELLAAVNRIGIGSDSQVSDQLKRLRAQIGGPNGPGAQEPGWQGVGGTTSDMTGKLEGMPSDVAKRTQTDPGPAAGGQPRAEVGANDIFDLLGSVNSNLRDIATQLKHREPGGPGDANLDLPAVFVGVEKRIVKQCFKYDVIGAFPFERNKTDLPFDEGTEEKLKELTREIENVLEKQEDRQLLVDEPKLLLVLVEGTADTTGSPQINRVISEARATFIHDKIEKALESKSIGSGKDVTEKVVIASYGTGEWSYRAKSKVNVDIEEERFFKPRSVLVRLCPLPLLEESKQADTGGIQSTTSSTNEPIPPN